MNIIDNSQDIIYSRDVIARIADLEQDRDFYLEEDGGGESWETANPDDAEELRALRDLAAEGEYSPDWEYGETLIRDSYFKDYAQDMAEDIGALDRDASWPHTCIDWEWAARELQYDYFTVDFDGVQYWIRS